MTPSNPPPGPTQRFIAELIGFKWYEFLQDTEFPSGKRQLLDPKVVGRSIYWRLCDESLPLDYDPYGSLPNWLGSLDTARELEVEDRTAFEVALFKITADTLPSYGTILWYTAEQWCYAWIRYKGWRWVVCDSCEGQPHGTSEDCTDCNGQGGEFVHD